MVEMTTKITSARIFRSGAEVTRRGTARLEAGEQELCVFGLSDSADEDTCRLFSEAGIRCTGLRFGPAKAARSNNEDINRINAEIDGLNRQLQINELQRRQLESHGAGPDLEAAAFFAYLDEQGVRLQKLYEETTALQTRIKKLQRQCADLKRQDEQYVMLVNVTAAEAGEYTFDLQYFEPDANWESIYEIYSDAVNPLELRVRGQIIQETEEDWKDVAISLFSGNPATFTDLPKLDPIHLRLTEPYRPTFAMPSPMMPMPPSPAGSANAAVGGRELPSTIDLEDTTSLSRVETAPVTTQQDETMTAYALPGTRDIPRGKQGIQADLETIRVPARYQVICVAKASPTAFLVANLGEGLPNVKSSTAGVYLNGRYSGSANLDTDDTDDVTITLGQIEGLRISRAEVYRKRSKKAIRGKTVEESVYEIKIVNPTAQNISMEVRDQVPVPQEKDIQVEVLELSGGQLEQKTGVVSWNIRIPAGQGFALRLGYRVTYPDDKTLIIY